MERVDAARPQIDDEGFTVIEMVVAITILAVTMMALATTQYGGLRALAAARQRSAFIELGNAHMEQMRSLSADQVGVSSTDSDLATAYPGGLHDGLPAVVLTPGTPPPPTAVEVVTTSDVKGIVLPYTVRRWVTRDPSSANDDLRRLEIQVEWSENRRTTRTVSLTSVWYPGGLGTGPPTNADPVINSATATPSSALVGAPITFTASAYDPDADGISVSWQFGDGVSGTGSTASHAYSAVGVYSVVLTVRDTRNAEVTSTFDVTAGAAANSPPVAQFAITSSDAGPAPFTVNVSGAGSSDPDGDALTYSWDWGDGTRGTGVNAGHIYSATGSYSIALTVTDPSGATSTSASQVVNVTGGCTITSASFKNPGTNTVANDIRVANSNKPANGQFVFTATTNLDCSSVRWSLQTTGGTPTATSTSGSFTVEATSSTATGGQKVWTYTAGNVTDRFPLGAALTGFATSSNASYSFTFAAHV